MDITLSNHVLNVLICEHFGDRNLERFTPPRPELEGVPPGITTAEFYVQSANPAPHRIIGYQDDGSLLYTAEEAWIEYFKYVSYATDDRLSNKLILIMIDDPTINSIQIRENSDPLFPIEVKAPPVVSCATTLARATVGAYLICEGIL